MLHFDLNCQYAFTFSAAHFHIEAPEGHIWSSNTLNYPAQQPLSFQTLHWQAITSYSNWK